ncbi:MAG TPA: xanthine dehydrogenase family protein molybdopterin-binding subunit [Conexibacter sp.]|jgi:carbon-monoxide dehydrogenase large subunit
MKQIGRRVRRVEDRALLCGGASFLDDLDVAGCLELAFVRSEHAHAHVRGVRLDDARRAPGVALAFGPRELADVPALTPVLTRPGAARVPRQVLPDRARFVGEPLAAVVASDRYRAEDAAVLVEVDYEPLLPVVTIDDALDERLPALHGEVGGNVIFREEHETGAVDAAMERAAVVVERTFLNPRYNAVPMEGRGVLAEPDAAGNLVVWSSTQIPHILQEAIETLLGLEGRVRVRCPDIGGGFGQKAHVFPEEIAVPWAALRLGRPVKWVEDRSENLLSGTHAREQRVRIRSGADARGKVVALEAEVYCDVGAYGPYPWGQVLESLGTPAIIPGPYDIADYRYVTHSLATNKSPQGAYRGVGLPVAAFVQERTMDMLADELGIGRAEIRRVNFVAPDKFPYRTASGLRYDSGNYVAALDRALEAIGYERFEQRRAQAAMEGRRLGIGFASYVEWSGTNSETYKGRGMTNVRGYDAGRVAVNPDGTVSVWTSCPAIGQGVATTFAQIVAEHLGAPFESVRTQLVDTDDSPLGSGSFASRSAISAGGALISVAAQLRARLIEAAAEALEANPDDIAIDGDRIGVRGSRSSTISLGELAARAERSGTARLDIAEAYDPEQTAYPYATHACVVEVDEETGDVRILDYVIAEDCGPEINPIVVEGQVHGATAQGIGGTLYEAMRYGPDGQLMTASFMDYLVPTACELPAMSVHHLQTPAPDLRGGVKGVGEGGTLAPPAALANAVADAIGAEVNELPITPELVLAAMRRGSIPA